MVNESLSIREGALNMSDGDRLSGPRERGMTLVRAGGSHSHESARVLSAHPSLLGNGLEGLLSFVLSPQKQGWVVAIHRAFVVEN